jgi:site-specific recombinase XerD
MNVKNAYELFIIDKMIENCTGPTIKNYENMVGYFIDFVKTDTDVSLISDIDYVKKYILDLKKRGVSGRTMHTYIKHIKVFYNWLYARGFIDSNDAPGIKIKYEQKIPRVFDRNEISGFMEIDNLRDRLLVVIVLDSGLRKRELVNLDVEDIKPGQIFVRGGKGRKDRIVPISDFTYQMIQEYVDSRKVKTSYLFQHYNSSNRLTYSGVQEVFRRLKKKLV